MDWLSQNRPAASLTGQFLASGKVPVMKKRSASILKVRETHSSPRLGGCAIEGGWWHAATAPVQLEATRAATGRLGR